MGNIIGTFPELRISKQIHLLKLGEFHCHCRIQVALSALTYRFPPFESWEIPSDYSVMYLDFLSAIVSQNRLNPIMQRAKNDRSVLRALPVYDNGRISQMSAITQFLLQNNF